MDPTSPPALEPLGSALSRFTNHHDKIRSIISERLVKSLDLKLGGFDGLHWISSNAHYRKDVRLEAKQFQENGALQSQLSDAIRVSTRDPRQSCWSEQGVRPRVHWTRQVLAYNDQLKHLVWRLGLAMDLGDQHRDSANKALQTFENDFFGSGESIVDGLKSLIEEQHRSELQEVPLAGMLWPITAGGLGLRSATVLCGQYQLAFEVRSKARKAVPEDRPDDWQSKSSAWSEFYDDKNVTLEPANCDASRTMNAIVEGFISRGKSISGGEQEGLSP